MIFSIGNQVTFNNLYFIMIFLSQSDIEEMQEKSLKIPCKDV